MAGNCSSETRLHVKEDWSITLFFWAWAILSIFLPFILNFFMQNDFGQAFIVGGVIFVSLGMVLGFWLCGSFYIKKKIKFIYLLIPFLITYTWVMADLFQFLTFIGMILFFPLKLYSDIIKLDFISLFLIANWVILIVSLIVTKKRQNKLIDAHIIP